jgi:hypothetical protein
MEDPLLLSNDLIYSYVVTLEEYLLRRKLNGEVISLLEVKSHFLRQVMQNYGTHLRLPFSLAKERSTDIICLYHHQLSSHFILLVQFDYKPIVYTTLHSTKENRIEKFQPQTFPLISPKLSGKAKVTTIDNRHCDFQLVVPSANENEKDIILWKGGESALDDIAKKIQHYGPFCVFSRTDNQIITIRTVICAKIDFCNLNINYEVYLPEEKLQ